ncbi:MAG TPA: Tat proofreading chaperone DmsD [Coriobacteriaceae bacterium]|nr:Tat proofreading chaperone DmsD [Coriobacteriaceae bacterium]
MTGQQTIDEGALAGIAFAGRTLGPLFRYDPLLDREKVEALYVALARSDAAALCEEWPFVTPDEAFKPIADMVRGAKRLEDELAVDNESLAATSSLADEYRRLFVGPAKKAAPPWGSVYTDRDQVVFGLSTLDLREWLRENGIEVRRGESEEPEDHIGTMLELMAWLADNRPELLGDYLQHHLLTWAPHFLALMQDATTDAFFAGLAALTRYTLLGIQDTLELEVVEPRFYR